MAADTEQVLHMNGGVGDTSYATNSSIQKKMMIKAKPILEESIKKMYLTTLPSCLKLADLGCSSGPNALMATSNIIDIVAEEASRRFTNNETPIFQIFLNDLFGNDFNTVFNSIPASLEEKKKKGEKDGPTCLFNATPGSFYDRLFPSNSINSFHSSSSLHWLSQVPKGLTESGGEALNKENIYISNTSPPEVLKAYIEQFEKDFKIFLRHRSVELMHGGGMFLTFVGRPENEQPMPQFSLLGMALHDMVLENLIEEAKLESFNLPTYGATEDEVRKVIGEEGSFTIQRLESIKVGWDAGITQKDKSVILDVNMRGEYMAKSIRAATEPLLKSQFGEAVMDELFLRFKQKLVQLIMEEAKLEYTTLILSLVKNA